MGQNILGKSDLGYFYQNRKKFDEVITNLMGADTHLHDISGDSGSQDNFENSFGRVNSNSLKNINKSKLEDVHNSFQSSNKMEKLYKNNLELQNKIIAMKDQLQGNKHKAEMWEQTKKFIVESIHPYVELKSIRFKSSDSALINQFFITMEEILAENQKQLRFSGAKDHAQCQETIQNLRKKVEIEAVANSRISLEREKLLQQNQLLQDKISMIGQNRKIRYSQIEESLEERFSKIQKQLDSERDANNRLREQIRFLEATKRTTSHYEEQQKNQYEMIKKISKLREEEIKSLQNQSASSQNKLLKVRSELQKYRTAFFYAKQLNDDFMKKLEEISKKDSTRYTNITTFTAKGTASKAHNEYYGDIESFLKTKDVQLPKKTRFKIVKSKSLTKQLIRNKGERYV